MKQSSRILSIQDASILLAERVISAEPIDFFFRKKPEEWDDPEGMKKAQQMVMFAKTAKELKKLLAQLVADHKLTARSPLTGGKDKNFSQLGDQAHVDILDAELALINHYSIQFVNPAADTSPSSEIKTNNQVTHKIQTRRNILSSIIELSIKNAHNPTDPHSAWASLIKLAEAENRPAPLLGYVEDEGVKYQGEKEIKLLSKKNFIDRINRLNTR